MLLDCGYLTKLGELINSQTLAWVEGQFYIHSTNVDRRNLTHVYNPLIVLDQAHQMCCLVFQSMTYVSNHCGTFSFEEVLINFFICLLPPKGKSNGPDAG